MVAFAAAANVRFDGPHCSIRTIGGHRRWAVHARTRVTGLRDSSTHATATKFLITRKHEWPLSELIGNQKVRDKLFATVLSKPVKFGGSGRAIRYVLHEAGANYVARDHMRQAISKWADSRDGGQDANEVLADLFGDDVTTTRRKAVFEQRVGYDGEWEDTERTKAHCYVLPSQARMIELVTHRFAD